MANQGTLEILLLGVDGNPARDPRTVVTFFRASDGRRIGRATIAFPPARRFTLPAFPQERATACVITPERYRHREVGIFTLLDRELIQRQPTVFRLPHRWTPRFTRWASLPASFAGFRRLLERSPDVRVRGGARLGTFTRAVYDGVGPAERITANAKACLLNLFAKLDSEKEPVHGRKPWFRFLTTLLAIGRERLVALADEELFNRVSRIHRNIDRYPHYKRTPAGDHYRNIPPGLRFRRSDIVSIKTREDEGNLQLTVTPAVDADGSAVTVLDADIDENGKLLLHLADLFTHTFTGGTHPFDIHEYLVLSDPRRDLGYALI